MAGKRCSECAFYKALFFVEDGQIVDAHCGRCIDPEAKRLKKVRASTKKACERYMEARAEESAHG